MELFDLPAREPALERIRAAALRGTLPHALLFTGGAGLPAARYTAAALECETEGNRPCGTCGACRKVLADIHPDVITVQDPEHKSIAMEVVRQIRADAYIRPNEGERKVYLFPDCSLLTEKDQNVLLKVVEEGPPYAAFLFCAENSAAVLQTLRSRCVELKLRPARSAPAEESAAAESLCRAIASGRRGAAVELCVRWEKQKLSREELSALLEQTELLLSQALLVLYGCSCAPESQEIASFLAKNLTKNQMIGTINVLQTYRADCQYNVGVGQVLGALAVELEGIL